MGIAERKEKQKSDIKKMILEASMKLFVEEGFENVTIRKIADIIQYSPTTIYLYFKDKNEIFYSLHELGFQKMGEINRNLICRYIEIYLYIHPSVCLISSRSLTRHGISV